MMRLNLFKSIVSILVLFASGFIIAYADDQIPLGGCRGLISCDETSPTFCSSMNITVTKVQGTYQKCPSCSNDGAFGPLTPFCGTFASTYYGCGIGTVLALLISEPNGFSGREFLTLITYARNNVAVEVVMKAVAHALQMQIVLVAMLAVRSANVILRLQLSLTQMAMALTSRKRPTAWSLT